METMDDIMQEIELEREQYLWRLEVLSNKCLSLEKAGKKKELEEARKQFLAVRSDFYSTQQ